MAKNQDDPTLRDAEEAFEAGDIETALEILDGLLPEDETKAEIEVLFLAAECLLELQEPAEAEHLLLVALAQAPEEPALLHSHGLALFEQGKLGAAEARFEQALAEDDEFAEALFYLGILAERRGEDEQAATLWKRAADAAPEELTVPHPWSIEEVQAALAEVREEAPEPLASWLAGLNVSVEDLPTDEQLQLASDPISPLVHCLFEGGDPSVPEGDEPAAWLGSSPERVVLFRRNLGKSAHDSYELYQELLEALMWETINFLGLEDEHLEALGLIEAEDE